jgi:hypothetical protein
MGSVTLDSILFRWDADYIIGYVLDQWIAVRRGSGELLVAPTLGKLDERITADDERRAGEVPGPDDEILTDLRSLFPLWEVWYSPESGCYFARLKNTMVRGDSLECVRIALTRIEAKRKPQH